MIMALLSAAASFSSCDGEKITDDLGLNADFYITSDKDVIQSNGTVADQLPDGSSLYNHYKKLIAIRKALKHKNEFPR